MAASEDRRAPLARTAHAARRAIVLDEAAREFNRMGVASARLAEISRKVGLSRAALYNYALDRTDLARQCYLRACDLNGQALRRALLVPGHGRDRVEAFIRFSLEEGQPPRALLNDIWFLPPDYQAEVRTARAANLASLVALVDQGIADGSIRPCSAVLACEFILGLLAWAPLSQSWTQNTDAGFASRMAAVIPEMVLHGVAANGQIAPEPQNLHGHLDALRRALARDDRLEELARAGSKLFNQRGTDGVSLDEVAAEIGASKGLIYHYFPNKREFIGFCYTRSFDYFERVIAIAEAQPSALAGAGLGTALNVMSQLDDLHPLALGSHFEIFEPHQQKLFTARTDALSRRTVGLIQRGIDEGEMRALDVEPVALASAGAYNTLAYWLPEKERTDPLATACEISALLLNGLASNS